MDKQTAIDLLDNLLGMVEDNHDSDYDTAIKMGIDAIKEKIQLSKEDATKGTTFDCISRQAAIDALSQYPFEKVVNCISIIEELPYAQPEPISEEYAKAVRTWLINYQVRCAELNGRYTPYEILGWIVSDWRKENEIW